ncbi:MAG: leucine-rich repeat protein, partial [Ruminococcus sp.]|nr:leucine-rich repeat protein [Ruminococcus sp.]
FSGCTKLKKINLSKNLKEMGGGTFYNTAITSIEIPASLTTCKDGPFEGCETLEDVTFESGTERIARDLFQNSLIEKIVIPNTVKSIGEYAFFDCSKLKTVIIGDSVETIGNNAFRQSVSLKGIYCSKFSKTAITLIDNNIKVSFIDESRKNEPYLIDTKTSSYNFNNGNKVNLFCNYKIKDKVFKNLKKATLKIKIPNIAEFLENSLYINKKLCTDCSINNGVISIPVSEQSGKISFSVDVKEGGVLATYAYIDYTVYKETAENSLYDKNHVYVYAPNRDNLRCYMWDNNPYREMKSWPGEVMEKVDNDIYSFELSDNYEKIIFNCLGGQTADLDFLGGGTMYDWENNKWVENVLGTETGYDIIDVISDNKPILTLDTDSLTNSPEISIEGVAPSEKDTVKVYINGSEVTHLTPNKHLNYSGKIIIPNAEEGKTYIVKAVSEKTGVSAETKVRYMKSAPKLKLFKMIYNGKEYDLLSGKKQSITFILESFHGKTPFKFVIGYDNNDSIGSVAVASVRNQTTKSMKATWDESAKAYIAEGYFDENNHDYVPGAISVSYTEKQDDFELNQNWVDKQLETELPDELKDYTTEKVEDTETYKEYNLNFSDKAEIKYIYERISTASFLAEKQNSIQTDATDANNTFAPSFAKKTKMLTGDVASTISTIEKLLSKGFKVYTKYVNNKEERVYSKLENSDGDIISWYYDPNADYIEKQIITSVKEKSIDYVVNTMVPETTAYTDLASPMFGTFQSMGGEYLSFCGNVIDNQLAKQEIMMNTSLSDEEKAAKIQELRNYQNAQLNITCAKIVGECLKYEAGLIAMSGNPIIGGIIWAAGFVIGDIYASNPDGFDSATLRIKSFFSNPFNWSIDPSGYVYEGVTSNRLKGVTTTAYWIPYDEEDEHYWDSPDESKAVVWNSDEYSQYNPLTTDSDGNYSWDVPEGWWKVKYECDGYETCYSDWLPVPPPQMDVNINMVKTTAPKVESVELLGTKIKIVFNTYINPNTVYNIAISEMGNDKVLYTLSYDDSETDAEGNVYAKTYYLEVKGNKTNEVTINIPSTVKDYADRSVNVHSELLSIGKSEESNIYYTSDGAEINLIEKFIRDSKDETDFEIGNEFKNLEMLGVQKKNDNTKSIRFVTVLKEKVLKDAQDYGYIVAGAQSIAKARSLAESYTLDNAPSKHVFSCKKTSNNISGDYGKYDAATNYKYVTFAVNHIGDSAVAAIFYVKDSKGNVFYSPYTNSKGMTFNSCSVNWAVI